MTVVIIGIILVMLAITASLYQLTSQSPVSAEVIASEYWWMTWPI